MQGSCRCSSSYTWRHRPKAQERRCKADGPWTAWILLQSCQCLLQRFPSVSNANTEAVGMHHVAPGPEFKSQHIESPVWLSMHKCGLSSVGVTGTRILHNSPAPGELKKPFLKRIRSRTLLPSGVQHRCARPYTPTDTYTQHTHIIHRYTCPTQTYTYTTRTYTHRDIYIHTHTTHTCTHTIHTHHTCTYTHNMHIYTYLTQTHIYHTQIHIPHICTIYTHTSHTLHRHKIESNS